jgi:hypothetical protein
MEHRGRPWIRWIVPVLLLAGVGATTLALVNPRKGYHPAQPIFFQHRRMAGPPDWTVDEAGREVNRGGYDIPCVYCHTMAYKGRHSTLPSTDICMNCHSVVGQDKEWVLVLKKTWDEGRPIPWIKVHDLPDFVYFDHSAHLDARTDAGREKVECKDCHGEVEKMDVVAVQHRFNMGWCLECHRKAEMAAPTDCVTCHR